jgi:hypothetical protein
MIRELLAKRTAMGLPLHPQAERWWRGWARGFRPLGPFGAVSVWSRLAATSSNGVELLVADAVTNPVDYAPDAGSLVDAGNDRVYWIVRGATFVASTETEPTTTRTPVLAVPHGTFVGLPTIPRGSHLMAEQATPQQVWIVRNEKRYNSTPALVTASGMAGQPVAIVPPGGLNQIPDGGAPYWLGGLYISDNARNALDRWELTPQVEGSSSPTSVGPTNRSSRKCHRHRTDDHQQPGRWRRDRLCGHEWTAAHGPPRHVPLGERTVPTAAVRPDHRHGHGDLRRP